MWTRSAVSDEGTDVKTQANIAMFAGIAHLRDDAGSLNGRTFRVKLGVANDLTAEVAAAPR